MSIQSTFTSIQQMKGISLEELSSVSLMNRIDTKFITTYPVLQRILQDAQQADYRVCEIDNKRLLGYYSVYYDTPHLHMYTEHRNKKMNRQKVRVRTYLTGGHTFLEIKNKTNKGRTKKKRMAIPKEITMHIMDHNSTHDFIHKNTKWGKHPLLPEVTTEFNRITLVNPELSERITIDVQFRAHNFQHLKDIHIDNLAIIELKQDGKKHSTMRQILLQNRVFPYKISKYCMAVSLTDPNARVGRFRKKLKYIEKLTLQDNTSIEH